MTKLFSCFAVVISSAVLSFAASRSWSWDNPPKEKIAELKHGSFLSASMNVQVGYNICLPPEYERNPQQRFPVIYYLHGYEGHESSYLEYARYWRESLSSRPSILVFVNGGETSFFTDARDRSVMGESVIVKELIPHIDQQYRTLAQRGGRSLHGYSMGGFGALKLGFKNPEMFTSVVSYGATLASAEEMRKRLGKVYAKVFGNDAKQFEANNPLALVERNAEKIHGQLAIWLIVGSKDEFLERNRTLDQRLKELNIPHEFQITPGAKHDKEDLYEKAAAHAFQFSLQHFATARKEKKP